MGDIRKQTIFSSLVIYIGFFFGALNTYLFTRQGFFTPDQYGLTQAIIAINLIFYSFANFGSVGIMGRFFPLYYANLSKRNNDLLTLAFILAIIGLMLTLIGIYIGRPLFVRKFSERSSLLVQYYYWIFPYIVSYVVFSILETQAAIHKKTVFSNFLKETGTRMTLTFLMLLYVFKIISFDLFVKFFSCMNFVIVIILFFFLFKKGYFNITWKFSNLTIRIKKRIIEYISYPLLGTLIYNVALNIDSITIGSQVGLASLAIYTLSKYISSVISVPQRSVLSIAIPYVSQAFKNKNIAEVNRIYVRSAINLLIIALIIFINTWLNLDDAYQLFHLDKSYESGKYVILVLGIGMIIEMGTGINSGMLYVSPAWRFEFINAAIIMAISIPTNYFLVKNLGIIGAAYSTLLVTIIMNASRYIYIWNRFGIQPFSKKTLWALLLALASYGITYLLFHSLTNWSGLIIKSTFFSLLYIGSIYYFKVTPDLIQVIDAIKKRMIR